MVGTGRRREHLDSRRDRRGSAKRSGGHDVFSWACVTEEARASGHALLSGRPGVSISLCDSFLNDGNKGLLGYYDLI